MHSTINEVTLRYNTGGIISQNGRLYEFMAELLTEVKELRRDVDGIRTDVDRIRTDLDKFRRDTNSRFGLLEKRIERLEDQQARTNVLLRQHGRDLVNIVNLLEHGVVHWGDKAQFGKGTNKVVGYIAK